MRLSMRGQKTELNALWARLANTNDQPPLSLFHLHLQAQILGRELSELHAAVRQLRGQLSKLHGIVLHQQTGPPPDPKIIQKIMDVLRK